MLTHKALRVLFNVVNVAVVVALLSWILIPDITWARPRGLPPVFDPRKGDEDSLIAFSDYFDAGSTYKWFLSPGWMGVMELGNGFLNAPSPGTAELVTPVIRSDYRFLTDVRIWDGYAYLVFRKGAHDEYRLKVTLNSLILVRLNDGFMTHLANANTTLSPRVWHTVEVDCDLDRITISLNGKTEIDIFDPEPLYSGSIALEASGEYYTEVDFDNVVIEVQQPVVDPWSQTNGPMGGPISTIAVYPNNPNIMYAGGNDGNIFRTIDGGNNWSILYKPSHDCQAIEDLIVSPVDPQRLYALVLNASGNGDLYRTSDGGEQWQSLFPGVEKQITCLMLNPSKPTNLALGTLDGKILGSLNDGDNWIDISSNLPGDSITDIAIRSNSILIVGTGNGYDGRLYYSLSLGKNWNEAPIFGKPLHTDIHSVFVDPANLNHVYIGLEYTPGGQAPWEIPLLYKTTNQGQSWSNIYLPHPGSKIKILGRDPGHDTLYIANGCYLYKNKGQGWIEVPVDPMPDGDISDMVIDPLDGDVLFLPRIRQGILKSIDAGNSWTFCDEGLSNTNVQLLTVSSDPGIKRMYVSAGLDVFMSSDDGDTWSHGGDIWAHQEAGEFHPAPAALQTNPLDPDNLWYISDVGQIYESQDSAATWNKLADPFMVENNDAATPFRSGSIHALTVSPSDPYTLYALKNGFGLFKSTHHGYSWKHLLEAEVDYTSSIAVDPITPDIVYTGTIPKPFQTEAVLKKTTDGGETWQTCLAVADSSGITSVAIDHAYPDTIYAGVAGYGGEVMVSNDAGDSWFTLNDKLNFTNVDVLTADPSDDDVAYAGVWSGGTFKTSDAGQTWIPFNAGETVCATEIMVDSINPNVLYLADRTEPKIYQSQDSGITWDTFCEPGSTYSRVLGAALAPGDPTVLYASFLNIGDPMAGDVFRLDNGVSTLVTGTLPRIPVAMTVDPFDANTVYAVLHAFGIFKTSDGGTTWTEISGVGSGLPQSPVVGFNGLVVDPNDTSRLYLYGGCDIDFNYMHGGANPFDMYTVYKSTDSGATWINLNDGMLGANSDSIKALAIAPFNPDILYIGCLNGVFRSTDAGTTWEDISSGLGFTHTAGATFNATGTRLYVPTSGGGAYGGTVDTFSGTVTWDTTNQLVAAIHDVQIKVDPSSSSTLFASAFPGGIFKSENGGATWKTCNFGLPSFRVNDPRSEGHYSIAVAPSNPDLLYLGVYRKGVFKSTDGGEIWQPIQGTTVKMNDKPITSLVIDPSDINVVYVSSTKGIFGTSDGGANWGLVSDGLDCLDVKSLAFGSDGMFYAGTRGYEIYSCDTNFGLTWNQLSALSNFGQDWPLWGTTLWQSSSILFSPTNPDLIHLGHFPAGFFQSTDHGLTWREATYGMRQEGILCLAFHPNDEGFIFAGTTNGIKGLPNATNPDVYWRSLDNGWPDEHWVRSITFDPLDADIMYACSKYGANQGQGEPGLHGTVMKSTDGGLSWLPITTGLNLDQEFYKIVADPVQADTLYLATQAEGIFISEDGGALWKPWNDGLTIPYIGGTDICNPMSFSADGAHIFVGTNGSGVFRRQF